MMNKRIPQVTQIITNANHVLLFTVLRDPAFYSSGDRILSQMTVGRP